MTYNVEGPGGETDEIKTVNNSCRNKCITSDHSMWQ